jgi:PAS domain S-box-containing protein
MHDHGFPMGLRQLHRDNSLAFAGLAIATVLLCFMLTLVTPVHPTHNIYPIIFIPAILAAAWYGEAEWGLLSTVLFSSFMIYFVLEPVHSFTVTTVEDFERLAAFIVIGACISWGASLQRRICDTSVANADVLRLTLENICEAVIASDVNGRISVMNTVAETLTGWPRGSAIGRRLSAVFQLLHEASREEINVLQPDQDGVIRVPDRTVLVARDGREFTLETKATVIQNGSQVRHLVLVFRDVGAARQYEREMEATAKQLRQVTHERDAFLSREQMAEAEADSERRMKDEFLTLVSHELRTPLTSILGWARALRESRRIDESLKIGLSSIDRNARLQLQLIEDLMDVSRMAIGSFRLERRDLDVRTIITGAIEAIRAAADEKRIRLAVTCQPGLVINADADRLQQVVWNLLSNAIKFTSDGGWIEVTCKRNGPTLSIQVQDNGRGFPPEFRSRLFQRFQQDDRKFSKEGVGLGLSIVRHIVELHGGSVDAQSDGLYKGATFTVTLPVSTQTRIPKAATTG